MGEGGRLGHLSGLSGYGDAVPELPEVESTRRHLAPVVTGRRIVEVEVTHPRTARRNVSPSDIVNRLSGRRVDDLGRRGKFLLATLDSGLIWVTHLGMSGRILVTEPSSPRHDHTHFVATTDRGEQVRLIDPRTFGFVAVVSPEELGEMTTIGPDALDDLPSVGQLMEVFSGRKAPIKALLLDQRLLAGLGNIYADEVLFRARVRPTRPAGEVTANEMRRLRTAVRPVLEEGIASGGTSLADLAYLLPDGQAGSYLARLNVYGREGHPCRRCGTMIERVVVGGRSSSYCPSCQT